MVAPRASSDEEESDLIRHALPRDTAAQEVNVVVAVISTHDVGCRPAECVCFADLI